MIMDIITVIFGVLLIGAILLQNRGTGLGAGFGGDGAVFRTKRGVEKKLHMMTIIIAVLFFGSAFLNLFI